MTDFLNNLWVAVSTPNPELIKILSIPLLIFLEIPLTLYMLKSIFNITTNKRQNLLYIVITSLVTILSGFFIPSPFNVIINYLASFIIIYCIFKTNAVKTLLGGLLPSFIFTIAQNLFFNPYITLLGITYDQAISIIIYKIPFALFMYLFIFICIYIIKNNHLSLRIIDELDKKTKSLIIANLVFGLIYIVIEIFITMKYLNILPLTFTFANFAMLLLYFIITLYSISKIIKLKTATTQLESAEEYNKTLHILHDNVRGFKHDFDNIVTTIGGYINTDDMEGLKKYYVQLEQDCEKVNNLYILNPDSINNPGIYNLLTSKYHEATEKGIDVNIYFLLDLNDLHMKIYEFARILEILLDNAIEAAEKSKEKLINISFRKDERNNRNLILIENSYANKDVDTEEIFNKGFTEKENHTGIGLWEVRKILSKNNNINLFTSKTDDLFKQQLEIYLN